MAITVMFFKYVEYKMLSNIWKDFRAKIFIGTEKNKEAREKKIYSKYWYE